MQLLLQKPIPPEPGAGRAEWYRFCLGEIIAQKTGGPYCHTEIRFRDGRSFSSAAPDGVRFLDCDAIGLELRNHRDCWDIVNLPDAWEETPTLLRWCEDEVGCGYDYFGAINSGIGTAWQDAQRWFCSELTAEVISRASGHNIPRLMCPNDLARWIRGVLRGATYEKLKDILPDPPCEAKRAYSKLALGGCPCGA